MNIGPCATVEDAAKTLETIRSYKPFKYGGTWFVSISKGEGIAYRNRDDLESRLLRENPGIGTHPLIRIKF